LDEKDPKVRNAVENIRNILQTKKIREKGAVYIINVLFSIYRSVKIILFIINNLEILNF